MSSAIRSVSVLSGSTMSSASWSWIRAGGSTYCHWLKGYRVSDGPSISRGGYEAAYYAIMGGFITFSEYEYIDNIRMKTRLAHLVSNLLNPFVLSLTVIMVLAYESSASPVDAFKWLLIIIGTSVLPVYVTSVYMVRAGQLDGIFSNRRKQRTKIYIIGIACAAVSYLLLWLLGAPDGLMAALAAALSASILFMAINTVWKISVHTAFVTAAAIMLIILYGWVGVIALAMVPLTVWARMELSQHSLAQALAGVALSGLIMVTVFYLFGVI